MTEENQKPSWNTEIASSLSDPAYQSMEWRGRTTDWFLQEQVDLVNRCHFSIAVTLFTPSGMITGHLISAEEYFRLYAETFSAEFPETERESIRQSYAAKGKSYAPSNADELPPPPQFLHLKEAKLCSPDELTPAGQGLLWRGTIASISGFSLGLLSNSAG